MKINYRGFDISVTKEKCMAGYKLTYFSVFRKSDGYEVISGYSDDEDTVQTWIGMMKTRVDGFIADPGEEILPEHVGAVSDYDDEYLKELNSHKLENAKTEKLYGVGIDGRDEK